MARAQFDRDEILEKSTNLFWQHGFSASSMQRVVQATGLKPGSIYLAFGNKEGLFRESLERYAEKSTEQIRNLIETAPTVGEGICQLLEVMIDESQQKNYCGCFLLKTRFELAAEDNELHELASSKLDQFETYLSECLAKDYDPATSRTRAASIMLHIFGIRTYSYGNGSIALMRQALHEGLPWLPWTKNNSSLK